ncbi:hypothetical protein WA1_14570 [Scytonema hofmannii PCC 7110]|uniref:DUF4149 domain-containing protein n=1 Tax=Scytonema hofmannii PCC 7110 TaxID=128403 RepID=A0A139XF47_9CYAN|nr:DUF4149 domain-containing protein [Scytonema hofmannii]KYC43306.1 hypothetical protein WA1_14570 [Scytonema hofmannii PCC 7110]
MNAISNVELKRPNWQAVAMLTLGFWLSASLVLSWVIMPSLYVTGMMAQSGFASAGYVIFWNFNRIELLCASLVLASVLALCNTQSQWRLSSIILSVLLLVVALVDTYLLTPQMSALGVQLNLFEAVLDTPANMNLLHGGYWALEAVKLMAGCTLLSWCWRR